MSPRGFFLRSIETHILMGAGQSAKSTPVSEKRDLPVTSTRIVMAAYFPTLAPVEFCKSGDDRMTKISVLGRDKMTVLM